MQIPFLLVESWRVSLTRDLISNLKIIYTNIWELDQINNPKFEGQCPMNASKFFSRAQLANIVLSYLGETNGIDFLIHLDFS